jgi:hypothetical protein
MNQQCHILKTLKLLALAAALGCMTNGAVWAKDGDGRGGNHGGGGNGGGPAMHGNAGGGDRGGQHENHGPAPSAQQHTAPSNGPQQNGPQQGGTQHESFFRGPDGRDNNDAGDHGDRSRVEDFLSGKGSDRNDFRSRFSDRDIADRNGENFRRNADVIRRDFRDRNRNDLPFQFGWWDNRRFDRWGGPWAYNSWRERPWYWWGWSTAPVLDAVFGWNRPYYWDYGPDGYIYYQDNQFYRDGQPYMAANEYYQQSYNLAHSAPAISPNDASTMEWMPLGVFAVAKEGQQEKDRMLQLAVNKEGVLSGTYYNQSNNSAHPVVGMVDRKTHRAAWYFGDGSNDQMVFETSLDNLTEPQSTVMVHFAPGSVGVWQLVRLEGPDSAQGAPGQTATEPAQPQQALP